MSSCYRVGSVLTLLTHLAWFAARRGRGVRAEGRESQASRAREYNLIHRLVRTLSSALQLLFPSSPSKQVHLCSTATPPPSAGAAAWSGDKAGREMRVGGLGGLALDPGPPDPSLWEVWLLNLLPIFFWEALF